MVFITGTIALQMRYIIRANSKAVIPLAFFRKMPASGMTHGVECCRMCKYLHALFIEQVERNCQIAKKAINFFFFVISLLIFKLIKMKALARWPRNETASTRRFYKEILYYYLTPRKWLIRDSKT